MILIIAWRWSQKLRQRERVIILYFLSSYFSVFRFSSSKKQSNILMELKLIPISINEMKRKLFGWTQWKTQPRKDSLCHNPSYHHSLSSFTSSLSSFSSLSSSFSFLFMMKKSKINLDTRQVNLKRQTHPSEEDIKL